MLDDHNMPQTGPKRAPSEPQADPKWAPSGAQAGPKRAPSRSQAGPKQAPSRSKRHGFGDYPFLRNLPSIRVCY